MNGWDIAQVILAGLWLALCVSAARYYHCNPLDDLRYMIRIILKSLPWS